AIYIKSEGGTVTMRGVLGETRSLEGAEIVLTDMDRHEVHVRLFR
ncbi:MAG: CooT family nickel-binding protein, partial [Euryarchaeota archaeon]|nr:CooT family nickel-binding protein [Euryarchaeota archaeon]